MAQDDFSRDFQEIMQGYEGYSSATSNYSMSGTPAYGQFQQAQQGPAGQQEQSGPYIAPMEPLPPPPRQKTPEEVSAQVGMPPPPPPPTNWGAGGIPPMPPPGGGDLPPVGQYMRQGMQAAQSNYINDPFRAQELDPGGMNYADPSMMTPTNQGIFRTNQIAQQPSFAAPYSVSGGAPPEPIFGMPFGAAPGGMDTMERITPPGQFSRGFDSQLSRGREYSRMVMGRDFDDYAQHGGEVVASMYGSAAGAAGGAAIGGLVGGGAGARVGMEAGSLVGAFAPMIPGVNEAAGEMFRPAIERRYDATRTQYGTRQFLSGGSQLDVSGSGLSTEASQNLMTEFDRMAEQSGGRMNRQDIVQLTQMAGEQNLLDMSQNSDEIAETMKNLTSLMGTMAEVTGDPDFQNNIKKIAQMRKLGMDVDRVGAAMQDMDSYARMAGMDIDQAMESQGRQGAAVFNSAGLSASQGMRTGVMGAGQAHMGVQGGVFDEQTLALYGGESGVSQHITESNAAFMSGPMRRMMLPYLMRKGEGGELTVDRDAIDKLMSGEIGVQEAASQGASKFHGDMESLQQFRTNSKEMVMRLGEEMGPEGVQQMMMSMAQDNADRMGISLRASMMGTMGLSEEKANVMARMAESPEYWKNLRQQQVKELQRRQYDADQARGAGLQRDVDDTESMWGRMTHEFDFSPLDRIQKETSDAIARHEENKALEAVGMRKSRSTYEGGMSDQDRDMIVSGATDVFETDTTSLRDRELRKTSRSMFGSAWDRAGEFEGVGAFGQRAYEQTVERGNYITGLPRAAMNMVGANKDAAYGLAGDATTSAGFGAYNELRRQTTQGGDMFNFGNLVTDEDMGPGNIPLAALRAHRVFDPFDRGTENLFGTGPDRERERETIMQTTQAHRGYLRDSNKEMAAVRLGAGDSGIGQETLSKARMSMADFMEEEGRAASTEDMRRILKESGASADQIDTLISSGEMRTDFLTGSVNIMGDSEAKQEVVENMEATRDAHQDLLMERHGEETGFGAAIDDNLRDIGFSGREDLDEEESEILESVGSAGRLERTALAAIAMRQSGDESKQQQAQKVLEQLQQTEEGAKAVAKAQSRYNNMSEGARDSLKNRDMGKMFGVEGDMEDMSGKELTEALTKGGKRIATINAGASENELVKSLKGKVSDKVSGVNFKGETVTSMMEDIGSLDEERGEKLGALYTAAKEGDRGAFVDAAESMTGEGGLTLGKDSGGAGVEAQKNKIERTDEMMARFAERNANASEQTVEELKKMRMQMDAGGLFNIVEWLRD